MPTDRYAAYDRLRFDWPDGADGGVVRITLDDPDKMNATDAAMHMQLSRVFRDLDEDPAVRAVVVTGAGRAFSAGGDLSMMSGKGDAEGETLLGVLGEMFAAPASVLYRLQNKALAMGAKGTHIGRAFVYGLGAMGEAGVTKALEVIHKELDVSMAFCGHRDINGVDRDILMIPRDFSDRWQ